MASRNLNKYERSAMLNEDIIKVLGISGIILNLFVPVFSPFSLGITSIFQWIVIVAYVLGLLGGLGYFNQNTPLLWFLVGRAVEVVWYLFVSGKDLNWVSFGVLLLFDVVFLAMLLIDKSNYEYVKVRE